MDRLTIVKIGGSLLENPALLGSFLDDFHVLEGPKLLVHGGGPQANRIGRQLGIEPQMFQGRRITDAATLDLVVMVYAGLNGKRVTAELQARGCNALSLSGVDGNLLAATKRPVGEVDFGFVGDVIPEGVNVSLIRSLLDSGYVPVLNAITHDTAGLLLNTNADTIAGTVAGRLASEGPVDLVLVLDRPGVLGNPDDDGSVIPVLKEEQIEDMKQQGTIAGGMMPKIANALAALRRGVRTVRIGDYTALRDSGSGTRIEI